MNIADIETYLTNTHQPYGTENVEAINIFQGQINERCNDDHQIKYIPSWSKISLSQSRKFHRTFRSENSCEYLEMINYSTYIITLKKN